MNEHDMLDWADLRRGLGVLVKKARPGIRTLMLLARMRPDTRLSLASVLARTVARYPDAVCLKYEHGNERGQLTYREFDEMSNRLAHYLRSRGIGRGDAVAIMLENRPELLIAAAALSKLGAVAAMLNTQQRRHVLVHSLSRFSAKCHIIGEECMDAFAEAVALPKEQPEGQTKEQSGEQREAQTAEPAALELVYVPDRGESTPALPHTEFSAALSSQSPAPITDSGDIRLSDACFYVLTSGTTGLPKASILSHDRFIKAGAGFGDLCLGLRPGDTLYAPLPLYHNMALTVAWSSALCTGAALAIRRKFSASAFWSDCRDYEANAITYIGEIPRYLVNRVPGSDERQHRVRKAVGIGLRPEIWHEFKQRFAIDEVYEIYAASELNVSFLNAMNLDRTVGFCPATWRLVAYDVDTGAPVRNGKGRLTQVAKGEPGLLVTKVSDRFRFDGYTDAEANEKKLLRDAFRRGDVWVHSGDIMRNIGFGHLQFIDRVGDTFRWKSENVATGEVEHVLRQSPLIDDCTVYGVEVANMPGRAGMAAVTLAAGAEGSERADQTLEETMDQLARLLAAELPAYAVPVFIRVVPSLEFTGTFKHRKTKFRQEGYSLDAMDDPLFVLFWPGAIDSAGSGVGYRRLSSDICRQIDAGEYKL